MTTLATSPVGEPDLLAIIADAWTPLHRSAADRFRDACHDEALTHDGRVDPNGVRTRLLVGGVLDIDPRQYAALWSTACAAGGYLEKTDELVQIAGEGSRGNTNKSVQMRRWIADDHVVSPDEPCDLWPGKLDRDGYGRTSLGGVSMAAHQAVWIRANGSIAEGLELDHLCRNRACVNLSHLEPVTHAENMARAFGTVETRTHCRHGHLLAEVGEYVHPVSGKRWCRECNRLSKVPKSKRRYGPHDAAGEPTTVTVYGPGKWPAECDEPVPVLLLEQRRRINERASR